MRFKGGFLEFNMSGSFLLFRGASMREEWLAPYFEFAGKDIRLPGSNSSSLSLLVALQFALSNQSDDRKSVLFVIGC